MSRHFDVIVVGLGTMGSATCYHLAKRGVKVLGLDRSDIPNSQGSHHGGSRVIRLSYYEHPNYVILLRRAYTLWEQLNDASGLKVIHLVGGLYLGHPQADVMIGIKRASEEMSIPHEEMTREDVRLRYPMFTVPESMVGVYEKQAGFVVPELAVAAHAGLAMNHHAVLHGHEPVSTWSSNARGITVTTPHGTYSAGHLVLAAGAWSHRVIGQLGINLVVTRQAMGWVWPRRRDLFAYGRFPIWNIDATDPGKPFAGLYYGFPMTLEHPGLKVAFHRTADPCDPDTVSREPTEVDTETFLPCLRRFLPDGMGPLLAARICLYTNTPDGHFIVDRHPEYNNVSIACGFSGHGFKFAPVIGELLADMAVNGVPNVTADFLRLSRFR